MSDISQDLYNLIDIYNKLKELRIKTTAEEFLSFGLISNCWLLNYVSDLLDISKDEVVENIRGILVQLHDSNKLTDDLIKLVKNASEKELNSL